MMSVLDAKHARCVVGVTVIWMIFVPSCAPQDHLATFREAKAIEGEAGFLAFSTDGKRLISTASGITVWDPHDWNVIRRCGPNQIESISTNPEGTRAFIGTFPSTWELWNLENGTRVRQLLGHEPTQHAVVSISPNARVGASSAGLKQSYSKDDPGDFRIFIWDMQSGQCLRKLDGHIAPVGALLFLPDSKRLLSASADWTLRLWNIESGEELQCDGEPKPLQWEEATINGKLITYTPFKHGRSNTTLSHDGHCLLSGRQLWDVENWKPLRYLGDLKDRFGDWNCSAFSPDGKRVLTGHSKGWIVLWDVATGTEVCRTYAFQNHAQVFAVAFFPDGRRAISGGSGRISGLETGGRQRNDPYMRIWELPE